MKFVTLLSYSIFRFLGMETEVPLKPSPMTPLKNPRGHKDLANSLRLVGFLANVGNRSQGKQNVVGFVIY